MGATARPASSERSTFARPSTSDQSAAARVAAAGQSASTRPAVAGQNADARPAAAGQSEYARPAASGQNSTKRPETSSQNATARPASSERSAFARPSTSGQSAPTRPAASNQSAPPRSGAPASRSTGTEAYASRSRAAATRPQGAGTAAVGAAAADAAAASTRRAAPERPSAIEERKRDRALRRHLRQLHELNAGLRGLCAVLIVMVALLWPGACAPDDPGLITEGEQRVVQPLSLATPTPEPTAAPTEALPTPEPTPVSVVISAAGDCTLGYDPRLGYTNSLPHELERQDGDYSYFFAGVLPVFSADDITVVNLECALTQSSDKVEGKTFCFKGDPLYRNMLTEGSIEVVSLGNNHSRDYKSAGFNDTVEALRLADVGFASNGISCIEEVNGVRVGFLSYRNNTPEQSTLKSDIASLRSQDCAIVVCSFHWGEEYRNVANSSQTKLGRAAVDYGADLVLGHHPHVIGSIELYKGKYICYSLGNFCFGGNRNPEDKDTFIFRQTFTLTDDGQAVDAGIEIVPCRISSTTKRNDYQPTIYGREDALRVLERLNDYSAPLKYGVVLDESVLKWDW